ncbi:MAG TPA: transcriptional repressor AgaR [Bacteroidales bacterium]|nr:transcriptional repressor AgaR [Bacteroidales bacterium]
MRNPNSALDRRTYILEKLRVNKNITVNELIKKFQVSAVTIRKDLDQLERKNQLLKVRGGAIHISNTNIGEDMDLGVKQEKNKTEKQNIGKIAVTLIQENDTIILDSGTTTMEIAKRLEKFQNITIITNALNIAQYLAGYKRFNVIIPGGYLRNKSLSMVGSMAESCLRNFFVDKLFLGIDSFDPEKGVSTPNMEEASINQTMISIAREVIAVFDSSKFHRQSFAHIAPLSKINTIITDSGISREMVEQLESRNIKVIIA